MEDVLKQLNLPSLKNYSTNFTHLLDNILAMKEIAVRSIFEEATEEWKASDFEEWLHRFNIDLQTDTFCEGIHDALALKNSSLVFKFTFTN